MILKKTIPLIFTAVVLIPSCTSAQVPAVASDSAAPEKKMLESVDLQSHIDAYGEVELTWDAKEGTEYVVKKTNEKGETETIAKTKSGKIVNICKDKGTYKYSVQPIIGTMPASTPTVKYLNVSSVNGDFDIKTDKKNKIVKITGKGTKDAEGYEVIANGKKSIIYKPKFKFTGDEKTTIKYKIRAFRKNKKTGEILYTNGITRNIHISDYDPDSAIKYAREYAIEYNPEFHDYNPQGGDCANFVSQCLSAGGLKQTDEWNYTNGRGSSAWISCKSMYALFSQKYEVIENPDYEDFEKGDIIMKRDLSHVVICSGKDENGKPLICAHNDKHCDDPLYGDLSNWIIIKPFSND